MISVMQIQLNRIWRSVFIIKFTKLKIVKMCALQKNIKIIWWIEILMTIISNIFTLKSMTPNVFTLTFCGAFQIDWFTEPVCFSFYSFCLSYFSILFLQFKNFFSSYVNFSSGIDSSEYSLLNHSYLEYVILFRHLCEWIKFNENSKTEAQKISANRW